MRNGKVVGGARIMPTTAAWGRHTYMLRDALLGGLDADSRRRDAVRHRGARGLGVHAAGRSPTASPAKRTGPTACSLIVEGLMDIAERHGGVELISLSPLPLMRALRQLGFAANRLGEPYVSEDDGRRYAVLNMPAMRATHLIAAE